MKDIILAALNPQGIIQGKEILGPNFYDPFLGSNPN
jgi:hypothetical protein